MLRSTAILSVVSTVVGVTLTGTIYCDNQFSFYFNGQLVATDPVAFTPHQAVQVSFEWDGVSDKVYAIECQDYASDSGYEYIGTTSPQLGDGALIAEFSDGTVTTADWKLFVVTHGPTDASIAAGCSSTNLDACAIDDYGTPTNWFSSDFDDSAWTAATTYTAAQAGWGTTPTWSGTCCTMTSPLDRSLLGCNVNTAGVQITVTESECQDPQQLLGSSSASFLWGSDMDRDNKILFRHTVATISNTVPSTTIPTTSTGGTPVVITSTDDDDDEPTPLGLGLIITFVILIVILSLFNLYSYCKSDESNKDDHSSTTDYDMRESQRSNSRSHYV
eukprot:TRINITY_DN3063_c0_g1_i3.p1 TRINITY_DN3063_c0_g1~~TRINITY_DN3063_c0_g1_i3.p1  ORF type:complete len:332 (+),score=74.25 TRINITY_DN3063_c0_g1_i3:49-1044(+)